MNEELIEKRLLDIEEKVDQLIKLTENTKLSEYKLKEVHAMCQDLNSRVSVLERQPGDTALKWAGMAIGSLLTILIGYIAVKIGIK